MESNNILDILQNYPLNHKLYSTAYGNLKFTGITDFTIHTHSDAHNIDVDFDKYGRLCLLNGCVSDICMLFPSRGNHMWSNWRSIMFLGNDFLFDNESKDVYIFSNYEDYNRATVRDKYGELMTLSINRFRFASRIEISNFCSTFVKNKPIDEVEDEKEYVFEPFEKVLVRDYDDEVWKASFYSHKVISPRGTVYHYTIGCDRSGYLKCIPFNDNTKKLVGTSYDFDAVKCHL